MGLPLVRDNGGMAETTRAVYIGGPSHGEIVGGTFSTEETEVILGPKPIWWNWVDLYRHYYRPTGNVACDMLVYEYIGTELPQ